MVPIFLFREKGWLKIMKETGTVGYIANSPYTTATGTISAGRIYEQVK